VAAVFVWLLIVLVSCDVDEVIVFNVTVVTDCVVLEVSVVPVFVWLVMLVTLRIAEAESPAGLPVAATM
jgi:hypothetical protein